MIVARNYSKSRNGVNRWFAFSSEHHCRRGILTPSAIAGDGKRKPCAPEGVTLRTLQARTIGSGVPLCALAI
jgi:hypothetical protein